MPRIFVSAAIGHFIVIFATAGIGAIGGSNSADRHILLALVVLLLSCLIQVVAFMYLTVTGKVIGQAVHLGHLGLDPIHANKCLKRSFMRMLGLIVAAVILVVITGARLWRTGEGGVPHMLCALALVVVQTFVYMREYPLLRRNRALVRDVLAAYGRQTRMASQPVGSGPT